ncbi:MAG: glutamate--tRNA ligase [Alphaproteobacteria bacterium]
MTPTVRFAPSPTGRLHLGNARIALINWLYARAHGGAFVLRIDDTDRERTRPEYDAAIRDDLAWLGLAWDRLVRQSDRLPRYGRALQALREAGHAYACYETADELAARRQELLRRGRPPVYDRAALSQGDADRRRLEAEGRRPHWRFRLGPGAVTWDDLVRGPQRVATASLSDPVIMRADGQPTYTLASVVDDLELGVSHVIRGEDHVTNTAAQLPIAAALGGDAGGGASGRFVFAHLPLLVAADGGKLSKRADDLSLGSLRAGGIEPVTIAALLARLGTADPVEPRATLDETVAGFDLTRFGRAPVRFDRAELDLLNHRVVARLPFGAVRDRLGIADADEEFWLAVRDNCARLADALSWWRVVHGPIAPVVEDATFLAAALGALPAEPWDRATWAAWTGPLAVATGRKGRALYRPLRLALTGLDHGPEMRYVLPLIGRDRAAARLAGRTA